MDFLDLFCGCGGFSAGFEEAGHNAVAGIDKEETCLKTFNRNHENAEALTYDISEEVLEYEVDLVIGSPPCQGFSHAKGERSVGDKRNNLVFDFIRWVSKVDPKFVVMENVAGIRNISEDFLDEIRKEYGEAGYDTVEGVLNSAEYGVPQKRERYFVLGVKKDLGVEPSLPSPTHSLPSEGDKQRSLKEVTDSESMKDPVLVGDAISDMPEPVEEGETADYSGRPQNEYQKWIRDSEKLYNHHAKNPSDSDMDLVRRIPEGKMYRSSRFGEKYIQVWDLYEDELSEEEQEALWFIARHRTRKDYKAKPGSGPGHIPVERIEAPPDVIRGLCEDGWLRRKEEPVNGFTETYDINTKSGVRPKYMRLSRSDVSNTIITQSFNPREMLHPTDNRGLSLREGARIQSFPDSFVFEGSFNDVARQIGNAVPPKLAMVTARHVEQLAKEIR